MSEAKRLPQNVSVELQEKKFDFYRYAARSFLLPLLGAVIIAVWAFYYPDKFEFTYKQLKLGGLVIPMFGVILCIAGFTVPDLFKYMADAMRLYFEKGQSNGKNDSGATP